MAERIEYQIEFSGDVRGGQQAQALLEAQERKIHALNRALAPLRNNLTIAQLGSELRGLQADDARAGFFGRMRSEINEIGGRLPIIGGLFRSFGSGAAVALAGITAAVQGVRLSLREWANDERALLSLDRALANRGKLVRSLRDEYADLSEQLRRTRGISGEQSLGIISTLLRFNAPTDKIGEYTDTILNMANKLGVDIPTSSMMFVRAMNGNTAALARYGIQIDKTLPREQRLAELSRLTMAGRSQLDPSSFTEGLTIVRSNFSQGLSNIGSWIAKLQSGRIEALQTISEFFAKIPAAERPLDVTKNKVDLLAASAPKAGDEMEAMGQAAKQAADPIDELAMKLDKVREMADLLAESDLARTLANIELSGARQGAPSDKVNRDKEAARAQAEQARLQREIEDSRAVQAEADKQRLVAEAKIVQAREDFSRDEGQFGSSRDELVARARALGVPVSPEFRFNSGKGALGALGGFERGLDERIKNETDADVREGLLRLKSTIPIAQDIFSRRETEFQNLQQSTKAAEDQRSRAIEISNVAETRRANAQAGLEASRASEQAAQINFQREQQRKEQEEADRQAEKLAKQEADRKRREQQILDDRLRDSAAPSPGFSADALARIGGFVGPTGIGAASNDQRRSLEVLEKILHEIRDTNRISIPSDERR